MFNNIGGKIKTLATVVCWIGIISSVIAFFVLLAFELYGIAFIAVVSGVLTSWIGSFFTYGFGQLIENTDKIVGKLAPEQKQYWTCPACDTENDDNNGYCAKCGQKKGVYIQEKTVTNNWKCKVCGTENQEDAIFCVNCGSTVIGDVKTQKLNKNTGGEWTCKACGNIWEGNIPYCTCGEERP